MQEQGSVFLGFTSEKRLGTPDLLVSLLVYGLVY